MGCPVILWACSVASLALAFATSLLLTRRVREHWPVAACLAVGLVIDLTVGHRTTWGIAAHLVGMPRVGIDLALWHLSNALVTTWPAALAWCAWQVFVWQKDERPEPKSEPPPGSLSPGHGFVGIPSSATPNIPAGWFALRVLSRLRVHANEAMHRVRRAPIAVKAILGAWLAVNAALVASWPMTPETSQRALHVAEVAALVAGVVAVIRGYPRREDWGWPHAAVLWLGVIEVSVVVVGPFRTSVYERWDLAQVAYTLGFTALAIGQVVAFRRAR